jgi:HD-GYP domain-containing protein (c-di-GMP phosphodiesterase class II)
MTPERQTHIGHFLHQLASSVANAGLYSREHARMKQLAAVTEQALRALLEDHDEFSLMRLDDELVIDELPWKRDMQSERLALLMSRRGIGRIRISERITNEEIHHLIDSLAARGLTPQPVRSTANLRFGLVEVRKRPQDDANSILYDPAFADLSREEMARLMEIYSAVKRRQKINVIGLTEIVSHFIEAFSHSADPFLALAPLRSLDEYSFTHATNVALLNIAQAVALGIDGQLLHDIGVAGLLHDVGKLFIPEAILNKPSPLDEVEWQLMRQHPQQGAHYLLNNPGVPRIAVVSSFEHHLRYDLKGYPHIQQQWSQNLCSQITAISDMFDSMMTIRPYRAAQPLLDVVKTLNRGAGQELHPELTRGFIHILARTKKRSGRQTV